MTWMRVASLGELEQQAMVAVEHGGEEIALFKVDGVVYATANVCTHAFARLTDGFLDGDCIECPVHQALFNVRGGEAIAGPATEALKTYPCRTEGDDIWVDI
jgi:nitrite reductase/ring-hydroxylating ferredoxin subunit